MRRDKPLPQSKLQRKPPVRACGGRGLRWTGVNNLDSAAATVEMHVSVDQRIKRKITPLAHPLAWVEAVADLTDEDNSGPHCLAAESFHPQTLRIGVTSVSARALSFFVCHTITSPRELLQALSSRRERNALLIKGLRCRKRPKVQAPDRDRRQHNASGFDSPPLPHGGTIDCESLFLLANRPVVNPFANRRKRAALIQQLRPFLEDLQDQLAE